MEITCPQNRNNYSLLCNIIQMPEEEDIDLSDVDMDDMDKDEL